MSPAAADETPERLTWACDVVELRRVEAEREKADQAGAVDQAVETLRAVARSERARRKEGDAELRRARQRSRWTTGARAWRPGR